MSYVTIHAAKTTLSKLIARVVAGEEIVIARGSNPVAKLVPLDYEPTKRKFGALRGKVAVTGAFFEPLPADELAAWEE
jgi:prevent-host-death family protein